MALATATAALIGSAVIGGVAQGSAAKKAAKAQSKAASDDIAFQRETRDIVRGDFAPAREIGTNALRGYAYELGMGEAPEGWQGYQQSPGFQFALDQGNANINALAGARGGLHSGATLQALQNNGFGMAQQDYGSWLSRIGGLVDTGQSAAGMSGQASQNAAAGVSNALAAKGNAAAAGAIGVGNAIGGAINNGIGAWQYMKGLNA